MKNYLRTSLASVWAETNLVGINDEGGVALWDLPPQFCTAYNPIIYKRTRYLFVASGYVAPAGVETITNGSKTLYRATEADTAIFSITNNRTGEVFTLSAESNNGEVAFDVSAIVKAWMGEQLQDMTTPIVDEHSLYVRYTVKDLNGSGWSRTNVAVNGVAQIGESNDLAEYVGYALTHARRISLYDGYALDYSVLSAGSAVSTSQGNTTPYSVCRVKVDGSHLQLLTESGVPILTDAGENIYILPAFNVPVVVRCVPAYPFYVRWINDLGGVDYWMFGGRQVFEASVKSTSAYERYTPNVGEARSNRQAYGINTDNTVVVGAQGLPTNDYNVLKGLPFSPYIEWYNEDLGKWIAVTVAKHDGERITRNNTHDIEITFALPAINTQF